MVKILSILIAVVIAVVCFFVLMGSALIAPAQTDIGPPPADISAANVSFPSASGTTIHGWFIQGQKGKGVIALFHGIRANRRIMIPRARFLHQAGYSVLLIDFQAHGESTGQRMTFGNLESKDVEATVDYIRKTIPEEPIGAIGISLGGASILLAHKPVGFQGVIIESVYPTIQEATEDRMQIYFGSWGRYLAPLLIMEMEMRLGILPEQLQPIAHIGELHAALLLMHGTADRNTTIEEAHRLFSAAKEPKQFWAVDGAAHIDLYSFAPDEYRNKVTAFFAQTIH